MLDGYNIIGANGDAGIDGDTPGATDIVPIGAITTFIDPTLADNGGDSATYAVVTGGPAQDAIPENTLGCGSPISIDQRNVTRPTGAGCDIGAVESTTAAPTPTATPTAAAVPPTATPTDAPTVTNTTVPPTDTPTDVPTATPTDLPTATPTATTTAVPPTATPTADNYRLAANSPAINAGVSGGSATDADGQPCPAGDGADLGAYEFQGQPVAALQIAKEAPPWIMANRVSRYALTVFNAGKVVAQGLQISEALPAGATYVAGSASAGGILSNGVLTWSIGDLAPGASKRVEYQATATQTLISNPTAPDRYRLSIYRAPAVGGGGGHTIVPYAIEQMNNDEYLIYVYENNAPNDYTRAIRVNRTANSWQYIGSTLCLTGSGFNQCRFTEFNF